jgi:DNA-binding GntR family transcriptional regulator
MPQFQRPPTTQQVVLDALRRAIQDGELLPGSTIRPDDIAARFGVSRIPVRESLKILEGQGLVEHSAHTGYVVPMLTAEDAVEIYAIRAMLETEALRRGLRRATGADRAAAAEAYEAASRSLSDGDPNGYSVHSNRFHAALFAPCAMPRLMRLIANVWDSTETYRPARMLPPRQRDDLHDEHRAILTAFQRGDAPAVIAESDRHREHLLDAVLEGIPAVHPRPERGRLAG